MGFKDRADEMMSRYTRSGSPRSKGVPDCDPRQNDPEVRKDALRDVFAVFDLDEIGLVPTEQLRELGRMIRAVSGHPPVWNEDQNARVLLDLDPDGDGEVSCGEFARSYERRLPMGRGEFDLTLTQFMDVARRVKLREVFDLFDLDASGAVEQRELLQLGQMRRQLGQKGGSWDDSQSQQLVRQMDLDGDGAVSCSEFVAYFDCELPAESERFKEMMDQFIAVGRSVVLARVFGMFDVHHTGSVTATDLHALGEMRQEVHWSPQKNAQLVRRLDLDGDGVVTCDDFVTHFDSALPGDTSAFRNTVTQFAHAAAARRASDHAEQIGIAHGRGSRDRLKTLACLFGVFDLDGSGVVEASEFHQIATAICERCVREAKWEPKIDQTHVAKRGSDLRISQLKRLFRLFDIEGSGAIEHAGLVGVSAQLSVKYLSDPMSVKAYNWQTEDHEQLMRRFDQNRNRAITQAEFVEGLDLILPEGDLFHEAFDAFSLAATACSSPLPEGVDPTLPEHNWTEEMNCNLMKKFDTNRDGVVSVDEFVDRFDFELPEGAPFGLIVAEFTQTAAALQLDATGGITLTRREAPISPRVTSRAVMQDRLAPLPAAATTSPQRYFAHDAHLHDTQAWHHRRLRQVFLDLDLNSSGGLTQGELTTLQASAPDSAAVAKAGLGSLAQTRSVVNCEQFAQHFIALLEPNQIDQFEKDMTAMIDTARSARIQQVIGSICPSRLPLQQPGGIAKTPSAVLRQVRGLLEGILEELDAKKERRRMRQLADTDRQVKCSLLWSNDIIEDFDYQVSAFSEAVHDVEKFDAKVAASRVAASEAVLHQVSEYAAIASPREEMKHCTDCHPIDVIEQQLTIEQLSKSHLVPVDDNHAPFTPRGPRTPRLEALRPQADVLSGHLQSQLNTLRQKSEQAQARLQEAEAAQREAQRTMDDAIHAL